MKTLFTKFACLALLCGLSAPVFADDVDNHVQLTDLDLLGGQGKLALDITADRIVPYQDADYGTRMKREAISSLSFFQKYCFEMQIMALRKALANETVRNIMNKTRWKELSIGMYDTTAVGAIAPISNPYARFMESGNLGASMHISFLVSKSTTGLKGERCEWVPSGVIAEGIIRGEAERQRKRLTFKDEIKQLSELFDELVPSAPSSTTESRIDDQAAGKRVGPAQRTGSPLHTLDDPEINSSSTATP